MAMNCFPLPGGSFPPFPGGFNPGFPGGFRPGFPGGFGPQPTQRRTVDNFSDAAVGQHDRGGFFGSILGQKDTVHGYGIDLNGDGQFDKGQDGVLTFDFDHDGKISQGEVEESRNVALAEKGNYDFDHDGHVSFQEAMRGSLDKRKADSIDTNHDGRFSARELSAADGHVWIDRNRDGKVGQSETHGVKGLPGGARIDDIDARNGVTHLSRGGNSGWRDVGFGFDNFLGRPMPLPYPRLGSIPPQQPLYA